jgi:hypothetical protein
MRLPSLFFLTAAAYAVGAPSSRVPGATAPPIAYVFVPVPGMRAAYMWADWYVHIGTLDADGEFHEQEKLYFWNKKEFVGKDMPGEKRYREATKVYEFRSGRLVFGTMMPDGKFVPDVRARALWLDEYRLEEDPPIWNGPGYFIRKDKFEEHRPHLAEMRAFLTGDQLTYLRLMKAAFLAELQRKGTLP